MTKRKVAETMQPVCMVCKRDMSIDVGYKSNGWFKGVVGVRVLLCSPECVDLYAGGG
jgi:hypothetical protein